MKGTTTCGWCMTGNHDQCRPEITYYDKVWACTCSICHKEKEENQDAN